MSASTALRCAFCHGPFAAPGRACPTCATVLHADCWGLADRCPTLGCASTPTRDSPRKRSLEWWMVVTAILIFSIAFWAVIGDSHAVVRVVNVGTITLRDVRVEYSHGSGHEEATFGDLDPGEAELEIVSYESMLWVNEACWSEGLTRRVEVVGEVSISSLVTIEVAPFGVKASSGW